MNNPDPLVGVPELAYALKISQAQVYRLASSGRIPHVRVGDLYRFEVAKVIASLEVQPEQNQQTTQP